jgi:hypothetical protein
VKVDDIQRRDLAAIGRMLQAAAAGQAMEGSQDAILRFAAESWGIFRQYFIAATEVETPEEHFGVDEYSDVALLTKPQITVSQADIFYIHEVGGGGPEGRWLHKPACSVADWERTALPCRCC